MIYGDSSTTVQCRESPILHKFETDIILILLYTYLYTQVTVALWKLLMTFL